MIDDVNYKSWLVKHGDIEVEFTDTPWTNGVTECHKRGEFYEIALLQDTLQHLATSQGDGQLLVLDVGANVGNHAVFWAAVAGAHVLAFEPNRDIAYWLHKSIDANELADHIKVYELALSRVTDRLMEIPHDVEGNSRYISAVEGAENTVVAKRLDDLCLDYLYAKQSIRVVKIDVEGMEADAILGAERLILSCHPVIYAEAWDQEAFDNLNRILMVMGYRHTNSFFRTYKWEYFDAERLVPDSE